MRKLATGPDVSIIKYNLFKILVIIPFENGSIMISIDINEISILTEVPKLQLWLGLKLFLMENW